MSFALTRRSVMLGAATAATAVAVPGLVPGQRSAHATPPGQQGLITYRRLLQVFVADADGSNERLLAPQMLEGSGDWAPDGSRFVFSAGSTIESVRPDGSDRFTVLGVPEVTAFVAPVFGYGGAYVILVAYGQLAITPAGQYGGSTGSQLVSVPVDSDYEFEVAVAPDGTVVYQHGIGPTAVIRRIDSFTAVTKIVTGGEQPDFSPDGTKLAFRRTTGGNGSPWVQQIWVADAGGTNQQQLTTVANAGTRNADPAWSADGGAILFTSLDGQGSSDIKRIDLAAGDVITLVKGASQPTCQPVVRNTVERVWGATALGTAVATSRYNWADKGAADGVRAQAKAVVLTRDDMYFDALGGSALAVNKQGPLLITPPGSLDTQTQAEIQRILGGSGTVYLLGGTLALSAKVENTLKTLGYQTVRLWGQNEYETAVAVAKAITAKPTAVIVATSLKYYDALAAGAAAGANPGTVIVLTAGDTMPAATAAYLNGLNPDPETGTAMIGVGGPGVRALINGFQNNQMPNWPDDLSYYDVFGATEFETAVAVAEFFFTGPRTAAIATATTWFDALTGGAMIGANLGPLLLSAPGTLSAPTRDYFSRNSSTISYGVLLGGPLALKDGLIAPLGNAISVPNAYDYAQYTETYTTAKAKTLSRSTAHQRAGATGRAGNIPGTGQRPTTLGR
ncbi:cell wall-binding repeat-containing protein [Dactylosporangium sp. NPDC049525]|uniref:cell wall-binding repeat-containing protein n=1 Tax=Dactylosporangium sp. NPDC049525 TaxID=3154730 RepID=UPI00343CF418